MLRDVSFEAEGVHLHPGSERRGQEDYFSSAFGAAAAEPQTDRNHGRDLAGLATERLSALGIGFVPEGCQFFADVSVWDNIRLGFEAQKASGRLTDRLEAMLELFPRVSDRLHQRAGTLPGGEQAMVALARALVGGPPLVIMDEPSLGLYPKLIDRYFDAVAEANRRGATGPALHRSRVPSAAFGIESAAHDTVPAPW